MNLRYFAFEHLPLNLQTSSKPFSELASTVFEHKAKRFMFGDLVVKIQAMDTQDPDEAEIGARKVLEAKAHFVAHGTDDHQHVAAIMRLLLEAKDATVRACLRSRW